ncbi:acyl-CoA thioesterase [Leeia sp. TBRC 13508]|uniref:Acyl-CoA thioesterase n=1 Tax=Leeia speluncae TaxID=2884804 RepID=A0ABS8D6U4_9NEIS|nr:thioesterase family protein [Leeia speluncae]MCB6183891.1 acyl-CoA thioesterase [Leeia speluncae]
MHKLPITIRGYHLDGYGHVNNARYLEFMEEGRWSLFQEFVDLRQLDQAGEAYVVVNINIDYRRAASMHDELVLLTQVSAYNRRHISVAQQMVFKDSGKEVIRAEVTLALMSTSTGRSMVIEGAVAELLDKMIATNEHSVTADNS